MKYRVVQKKWPLFKNSLPSAAMQLGLLMHSQSDDHGKFKLNSLYLAPFLLLNPVAWNLHHNIRNRLWIDSNSHVLGNGPSANPVHFAALGGKSVKKERCLENATTNDREKRGHTSLLAVTDAAARAQVWQRQLCGRRSKIELGSDRMLFRQSNRPNNYAEYSAEQYSANILIVRS